MTKIYRKRVIGLSTSLKTSKSYKVDTRKVWGDDELILTVEHESHYSAFKFYFEGTCLRERDSIYFSATHKAGLLDIAWTTVQPVKTVVINYTRR